MFSKDCTARRGRRALQGLPKAIINQPACSAGAPLTEAVPLCRLCRHLPFTEGESSPALQYYRKSILHRYPSAFSLWRRRRRSRRMRLFTNAPQAHSFCILHSEFCIFLPPIHCSLTRKSARRVEGLAPTALQQNKIFFDRKTATKDIS